MRTRVRFPAPPPYRPVFSGCFSPWFAAGSTLYPHGGRIAATRASPGPTSGETSVAPPAWRRQALGTAEPLLASLYAASVASRIATGSRSGQRVLRVGDRIDADDLPMLQGERCASVGGVSIHANVAVPAR